MALHQPRLRCVCEGANTKCAPTSASLPRLLLKAARTHQHGVMTAGHVWQAAEKTISTLFSAQRCEDLPLEMVREATGLPKEKLDALIHFMDNENKLMCRAGVVYLI